MSTPGDQPPSRALARRARLSRLLPQGGQLTVAEWRRRHVVLLAALWAHVLGLPIFGLSMGVSLPHALTEAGFVAIAAGVASAPRCGRRTRSVAVSVGLITASAIAVHLSNGAIEAHFHFFVVVAAITLYEDWAAFLVTLSYVVVEHLLGGALAPGLAFNHPGAAQQPWLWVGIHGAFVSVEGLVCLALWRLNEASRARTALLLDAAGEGIYGLDPHGRVTFANPAAERLLGRAAGALIGRAAHATFHVAESDAAAATGACQLGEPAADMSREPATAVFVRADGQRFPVECTVTPVRERGVAVGSVVTFRDVTARARAEAALRHQALHDALTGLPNRTLLQDRLDQAILAGRRAGRATAVLLIDLDRFKAVNDALGHQSGDELLRQVGRRLRETLRASDTLARLGADEFAAVLAVPGQVEALGVAAKLLEALEAPFDLDGTIVALGASIGLALAPHDGEDAATLLRRADVAMYAAKRIGGGCEVYAPGYDADAASTLGLASELRLAIERDELVLHYQPKVDMRSGRTCGAEALVRWPHPQRGLIPPVQFIPLAEQTGLIRLVTRWVIEAAIRQSAAWAAEGLRVPIAVNISPRDLQDPQLPARISRLLAERQVDPALLHLEITENSAMASPERTLDVLGRLRGLGLRIAIDDFGTGYSSLSYLQRLPVQQLKIDRSFVRSMAESEGDRAIVRSTIDLSHNLGLTVIAEGVEDEATLDVLAGLGCDEAQGYYLAKPLPADEFARWLRQSRWGAAVAVASAA